MEKRLTVVFVVCIFLLSIFAGGALAATAEKKSSEKKHSDVNWKRHISEDVNVDAPGYESYLPPPKGISKYLPMGMKQVITCDSIKPECGDDCPSIQHDQIGSTWYEYQQNASMGRMISVTDEGFRHFSWMFTDCNYLDPTPPCWRYVDANCKDPWGGYIGQTHADSGENRNAGYPNQTHLNDGISVIVHHRTAGTDTDPCWWSMLTLEESLCGGNFSRLFDIPDSIAGAPSGENGLWPKADVFYDELSDTNYIHIVMTEGKTEPGPNMLGYVRCEISPTTSNTMICRSYVNESPASYTINANVNYTDSGFVISHFDTSCSVSPVVVTSPVSRKVTIAWLPLCRCDGTCDYIEDVAYIESMDNGNDWIDGTNWPPVPNRITDFGCSGNERCFHDLSACYDYLDSLHIVYVTAGFPEPGYYQPGVARLYHWTERDGLGAGGELIATGIWGGSDAGAHNCNIAKPSISAVEDYDSTLLYVIWTQFDSADWNAGETQTNGDIYGTFSSNGGYTWWGVHNLTNTKTPGCAPGECVSEHWSTLAKNMYDGDLHIQYICDRDPGGAIMQEGEWMDNPVYYLHLTPPPVWTPWPPWYRIDPPHWCHPPLKVEPGGSRPLSMTLFSGDYFLEYTAFSDHDCIPQYYHVTIPPRDSVTLLFTVQGSGVCNDIFIDAKIFLTISETREGSRVYTFPVQAVVADDYYECPRDPETEDTLENNFLRFYANANCQEWAMDLTIEDEDLQAVFFQGGLFVAATRDNDTLVGRYMGDNDMYAGAQDKLHLEDRDDHRILHTWGTFMHDFEPPADPKWYWWVMNKEIVFFKDNAQDALQHCVIKYMNVERKDPPSWWPEQPTFTGYDDTYIGLAMDIDCPWDTSGVETGDENGVNKGRYDDVNHIAYQLGFGREHPEYNLYCAGIALADGGGGLSGEEEPYGAHNVKNNQYLYPQSPWGWKDGELYQLSATPGITIQDGPPSPDSLVDRAWVFTAQKIDAGSDPETRASFTLVEVVAPEGLTQLQAYVDIARVWVDSRPILLCGDCNGNGIVGDLGDIVYLISYVFREGPEPEHPPRRGDVNSDGIINLGDIVYLISYVFRHGPAPNCPGMW